MNQTPSCPGQDLLSDFPLLLKLPSPILPRAASWASPGLASSLLAITPPAVWAPATLIFIGQACDYLRAFPSAVSLAWVSVPLDFPVTAPLGLL